MIEIRVPATSANLGPGFDCLGMALAIYNRFLFEPADDFEMYNVDPRFDNDENLFLRAFMTESAILGKTTGIHVDFACDVPICRGLGSSAAMYAGGIIAANLVNGIKPDVEQCINLASELERHPDNAAPCILGGATACLKRDDNTVLVHRLDISDRFRYTILVPDSEVPTEQARAILPKSYPLSVAASNGAHAIMMVEALRTGSLELLREAAVDLLHEPYRSRLIPNYSTVRQIVLDHTDGAFLISGSGSTCIFISHDSLAPEAVNEIMELPDGWQIVETNIARSGIEIKENGVWRKSI